MSDPHSILATARQAWLADQFDRALDLLRRARQADPDDLRLAVEVASYLGMRFEVSEAVEILRSCESRLAGHSAALHQVGLAYERSYRSDDAMRCFQMATEPAPYEPALLAMVAWYERRGKLELAVETLGKCMSGSPEVQLWRGRLLVRQGDREAAAACFEALAAKSDVSPQIMTRVLYELGEIGDREGRAADAIQWATAAKRLQSSQLQPHLAAAKALSAIEQNFVATATREYFEKWQQHATHRPVALLAGTPRSGTSLMARMLGMHPAVVVADEIEAYATHLQPRMLAGQAGSNAAEILNGLDERHLHTCRVTYEHWMSEATGRNLNAAVLLDKFPSTTFLIPAFRRLFPSATIIMPLRDPRDVVVSCFLRHLPLNPVSALFARLDWTVARCCAEWKAWLHLRDRLPSPWVEVRYEDIVAGDYRGLEATLQSLGIDWDKRFADFQSSLQGTPARSPTYAQLQQPVTGERLGRWKKYASFLQPHLVTLNEMAKALGYGG